MSKETALTLYQVKTSDDMKRWMARPDIQAIQQQYPVDFNWMVAAVIKDAASEHRPAMFEYMIGQPSIAAHQKERPQGFNHMMADLIKNAASGQKLTMMEYLTAQPSMAAHLRLSPVSFNRMMTGLMKETAPHHKAATLVTQQDIQHPKGYKFDIATTRLAEGYRIAITAGCFMGTPAMLDQRWYLNGKDRAVPRAHLRQLFRDQARDFRAQGDDQIAAELLRGARVIGQDRDLDLARRLRRDPSALALSAVAP